MDSCNSNRPLFGNVEGARVHMRLHVVDDDASADDSDIMAFMVVDELILNVAVQSDWAGP